MNQPHFGFAALYLAWQACRRGKGSHAAVDRLQAFTRKIPSPQPSPTGRGSEQPSASTALLPLPMGEGRGEGWRQSGWYLQLDMLHLARVLLTGNPAHNADYVGNPAHLQRVPAHKQLANAAPEKGLPIGNLSSQFFANVYLNELDQFIKHRLKASHYVRYVDDFVLLHQDPGVLAGWRSAIVGFLHDRLGLALRDAGRLAPITNGIDFLGYIIRPDYRLVRRRVVGHMDARLAAHAKRMLRSNGTLVSLPAASDAVQATLASYFGHFRHARSARLQARVFAKNPWLSHILAPLADAGLKRVDRPDVVTSLASQWTYFRARCPQHVLLVQVGNRWECQGPAGTEIASVFRRQSAHRKGLPQTWALAAAQVATLKRMLTRSRQPWCEVCENGYLLGGKKRRQLAALWPALPALAGVTQSTQENLS